MPFDDTSRHRRRKYVPTPTTDERPYWILAGFAVMALWGVSPLTMMMVLLWIAVWRPLEELTDLVMGPAFTRAGEPLGLFGRLTYDWLWTDEEDHQLSLLDEVMRSNKPLGADGR